MNKAVDNNPKRSDKNGIKSVVIPVFFGAVDNWVFPPQA
jgi:hypothetical protein